MGEAARIALALLETTAQGLVELRRCKLLDLHLGDSRMAALTAAHNDNTYKIWRYILTNVSSSLESRLRLRRAKQIWGKHVTHRLLYK